MDNGFSLLFVKPLGTSMVEKEILEDIGNLKEKLMKERARLGPYPLTLPEFRQWSKSLEILANDAKSINRRIDDFNLGLHYMQTQLLHVHLDRLAEKCLKEGPCKAVPASTDTGGGTSSDGGLLSALFNAIWK